MSRSMLDFKFRVNHEGELHTFTLRDLLVSAEGAYGSLRTAKGVMQFIGLHDAHGREIYEGDVVRWKRYDGTICSQMVQWNPVRGGFLPAEIDQNDFALSVEIIEEAPGSAARQA